MMRVPHPPYSFELAPTDLCLFEAVKRPLNKCSLYGADGLLSTVQEILDGFEKSHLIRVF
jgi:hypothetical protein